VRDVAIPLNEVPTASPHEPLTSLMERMAPDRRRARVMENSQVVGIVTASDITQLIDVHALAHPSVSRR
jgi:CBS domain-containing protein